MSDSTPKHQRVGAFSRCPIDIAVHLVSSKWTMPLVRELLKGPQRPCDLERTLAPISAKTLSERLNQLQEAGLVRRTSHAEVPPRVEYNLTELGQEVRSVLEVLKNFGEKWMEQRGVARYDRSCITCLDPQSSDGCPAIPELAAKTALKRHE
jgi:DNA-binding HxlR family transcriptional regulator